MHYHLHFQSVRIGEDGAGWRIIDSGYMNIVIDDIIPGWHSFLLLLHPRETLGNFRFLPIATRTAATMSPLLRVPMIATRNRDLSKLEKIRK